MNRMPWAIVGLVLLLTSGCEKKDDPHLVNPHIDFLTDSGYTYQNDTVGMQDSVLVGVKVTEGTESLLSFKVAVYYDGLVHGHTLDSIHYTGPPFTYTRHLVTRNQAGTERYAFTVLDGQGSNITRNLFLTVQ